MPLPDLDILVAIVDSGSMTAAADALGLPRATLTRRLARLEEDVGARLFNRTTRQVAPTDVGMELYRHARPIVEAVSAAKAAVRARDGVPRGLLRVTLPPGGDALFGPLLATFMVAYPEVRLEVLAVTRHVDLLAEGFDVGIRAGELHGSALISRRLFGGDQVAVASPAYLAAKGRPEQPEDLASHDCLVGFARGEVPRRTWPRADGAPVSVRPRMASNDLLLLRTAAKSGLGIALLPLQFVKADLADRSLQKVLPGLVGAKSGVWVVYPEKRLMLPRVRAFLDHLTAYTATSPMLGAPRDVL